MDLDGFSRVVLAVEVNVVHGILLLHSVIHINHLPPRRSSVRVRSLPSGKLYTLITHMHTRSETGGALGDGQRDGNRAARWESGSALGNGQGVGKRAGRWEMGRASGNEELGSLSGNGQGVGKRAGSRAAHWECGANVTFNLQQTQTEEKQRVIIFTYTHYEVLGHQIHLITQRFTLRHLARPLAQHLLKGEHVNKQEILMLHKS